MVDVFLGALTGDGSDRVRELQWRQGEMLSVERSVPSLKPAGKVLHLRRERAATMTECDRPLRARREHVGTYLTGFFFCHTV